MDSSSAHQGFCFRYNWFCRTSSVPHFAMLCMLKVVHDSCDITEGNSPHATEERTRSDSDFAAGEPP